MQSQFGVSVTKLFVKALNTDSSLPSGETKLIASPKLLCRLFLLLQAVVFLTLLFSNTMFALPVKSLTSEGNPAALEKLLGNLNSMHAAFHEVAESSTGERVADGQVWIQKPGKFYWENTSPSEEIFLSDGASLWHYQPDLLQATKSPLSASLDQTPLLLLSGKVSDISALFTVSEVGPNEFLLIPKKSSEASVTENSQDKSQDKSQKSNDGLGGLIESITLKFNSGNSNSNLNAGQLLSFSLKSSLGQETTVTFSNVEWNTEIPASRFQFTLPSGADLFEG